MSPPRSNSSEDPDPANQVENTEPSTTNEVPANNDIGAPERAQSQSVTNDAPESTRNTGETDSTPAAAPAAAAPNNTNSSRRDNTRLPNDGFPRTFTFSNRPGEESTVTDPEAFAERVRHYLQVAEQESRESQESDSNTIREQTPDATGQDSSPASPNSMNFFDELLDTMLGHRHNDTEGANRTSESAENRGNSAASGSESARDPNAPGGDSSAAGGVGNVDNATIFTTPSSGDSGATDDSPGAIIITVNYMFMDGAANGAPNGDGTEPAPGRTGSLVVTIPNNATNREPHIISSFISLATRMAYSALIHNGPKPKPGITLEKFRSFKSLDVDELADKTCSVCFEQYDRCSPTVNVEDLITTKRRKLSPNRHVASASATPEPSFAESAQIERENPPAVDADSANTPQENTSTDTTGDEPEQKVYLCDHDEEFDHTPLQMPCNHVFGRSCLAHWLKEHTNCPLCRLSVAEPGQAPARNTGTPAISYIRFGGVGDLSSIQLNPPSEGSHNTEASTSTEQSTGDQTSSQDGNQTNPAHVPQAEARTLPNFLRRATSVIFNQSARRNREVPPSPLDLPSGDSGRVNRERNPQVSPMINNLQNFLRRPRRQRENGVPGSDSLFSTGVSSRRTPSGVETVSSDADPLRELFHRSRSFMNHFGANRGPQNVEGSANVGTSNPENESNDSDDHHHPDGPSGPSDNNGNA